MKMNFSRLCNLGSFLYRIILIKNVVTQVLLEILVKNNHWNKENFQCGELQKASTLGKVVCRRWKTKSLLARKKEPKRKLVQHKINPFLFDSSSPDDIIRKAQSQSFNRVQPK